MVVEPFANDKTADNINPLGRMFYSASTMVCINQLSSPGARVELDMIVAMPQE